MSVEYKKKQQQKNNMQNKKKLQKLQPQNLIMTKIVTYK